MAVITVSREYGSRGEQIAQRVAKELGYGYFDKEILTDVARDAHTTAEKISLYDEKDVHGLRVFLKQLLGDDYPQFFDFPEVLDIGRDWLQYYKIEKEPSLDPDEVTSFFHHVVERLQERGNVVIVGRGGQQILAGKPNTLHLRFIASIADRATHVMEDEGITHTEALEKIEAVEKQRAHYLKHYYDVDWADASLYHLVLNTSLMGMDQAVKVIIMTVQEMRQEEKDANG